MKVEAECDEKNRHAGQERIALLGETQSENADGIEAPSEEQKKGTLARGVEKCLEAHWKHHGCSHKPAHRIAAMVMGEVDDAADDESADSNYSQCK